MASPDSLSPSPTLVRPSLDEKHVPSTPATSKPFLSPPSSTIDEGSSDSPAPVVVRFFPSAGQEEAPDGHDLSAPFARDPQTWSTRAKWGVTLSNAAQTFAVSFSSAAYSGAITAIQRHFGVTKEVVALVRLPISAFCPFCSELTRQAAM